MHHVFSIILPFPGCDKGKIFIISERFTLWRFKLLPEIIQRDRPGCDYVLHTFPMFSTSCEKREETKEKTGKQMQLHTPSGMMRSVLRTRAAPQNTSRWTRYQRTVSQPVTTGVKSRPEEAQACFQTIKIRAVRKKRCQDRILAGVRCELHDCPHHHMAACNLRGLATTTLNPTLSRMLSPQHILALGFVPGMTLETLRGLLDTQQTLNHLLKLTDEELTRMNVKGKAIRAMRDMTPYLREAERQMRCAEQFGASIVHRTDEQYPPQLREIWSAPVTLYVWGQLTGANERAIGIVGTRTASVYGRITTEKYAEEFARSGVTVISGLARGIDTCAHRATMKSGGRTVAVIASGLDCIQPALSAELAREISMSGAVVTEYPFGVKAMPAYFPQRNRIISGMTHGTVVVESDAKGGALITARFALDQNREVFAVPGPVSSPKSNGTNELIRTDRARLTRSPNDVLEALGFRISIPGITEQAAHTPEMTLFEEKIYELLGAEPVHADMLCKQSGFPPGQLMATLLTLEFKGLARQIAGKMFLRT